MSVCNFTISYTAKYTEISTGYMGQIVEWPEVVTEGMGHSVKKGWWYPVKIRTMFYLVRRGQTQ